MLVSVTFVSIKMTTNRKNNKVEAEIERYRGIYNWDKALEITRTQWTKSNNGLGEKINVMFVIILIIELQQFVLYIFLYFILCIVL